MVVKTAWHAVVAKLGPLPPACKSLNNDELSFIADSLDQARRAHESELDRDLEHWLRGMPALLRKSMRRLLQP